MVRVQVLLSTYNGQDYLVEQLDSLRAQVGIDVSVLARDDGSQDNSYKILSDYAHRWPALHVLPQSQNMGVVGSFFEALCCAPTDFDFYAFCDQDDVWLPQKLSVAVQALTCKVGVPALYFSRLQYVGADLRRLGQSDLPHHIEFGSALIENIATGCSMVMNNDLVRELRQRLPATNRCLMHDWWAFLCALGLGDVVYDPRAFVLYRQHRGNVVGASSSLIRTYLTKVKRFLGRKRGAPHLTDQAREYLEIFESRLSGKNAALIRDFVNSRRLGFLGRCLYAIRLPLRRQRWLDSLLFRILILLGRY